MYTAGYNPQELPMKTSLTITLSAAMLAFVGCSSNPGTQPAVTPVPTSQTSNPRFAAPAPTATGQPYDFYLLNLSWSPEYCVTNAGAAECTQHLGFVVHGLWPQNNDGTYPQNCGTRPGPTDADWQGLMPTAALALHEWVTHGTCTPYDAPTYFGLIRKAFGEVKIPADFTANTQPASEPPAAIIGDFAAANSNFPQASIAVSCGNNALTAMEFCLDKNLNPEACQSVKPCGANTVKIPPR
jgi:ribonuclease T2